MRLTILLLAGILVSASRGFSQEEPITPLPLPSSIRVQSAGPRSQVWDKLSPKEKQLAYHLIQAADAGRTLLFQRTHRHSLAIQRLLEDAFSKEHFQATKTLLGEKGFDELLLYAAKFLDQGGPYAGSNRKYVLKEVTPDQVKTLISRYAGSDIPKQTIEEITSLLCDPKYETQQAPEHPDGKGLEKTGNNYYEKGITGDEVATVLDKSLKPDLNSRVIRSSKGLACETLTVQSPGAVGTALRKMVEHLKAARDYALTAHQKAELDAMVKYFETGNVEEFREPSLVTLVRSNLRSVRLPEAANFSKP